jgi:hypothetical protein
MESPINPVDEALSIFERASREKLISISRLGEPVIAYDFAKAIMLLVHMQASQMQLSAAVAGKEGDRAVALINEIATKMDEISRIASIYTSSPDEPTTLTGKDDPA